MNRTFTRRGNIALLVLISAAAFAASPAQAITNGEPDGNRHPYVGILVDEFPAPGPKQRFCSGTLVAPRIMVSAAHCYSIAVSDGQADQIFVSFDSVYDPAVSTLYHATMVPHPEFVDNLHSSTLRDHDIAVLHLDAAPSITPAGLPTAGLLSSLDLLGQTFTAVGYGRTRVDKTAGPNNIGSNRDPSVRNVGIQEFRSLQSRWLTASGNPSTGAGNWCFGDSGSANYLGDSNIAVSVASTVDNACRSYNKGYRLDTASARQFLAAQGVPLP